MISAGWSGCCSAYSPGYMSARTYPTPPPTLGSTSTSRATSVLHLLRTNRDIRLLFCAQVISFLGDWFVFVALAGYVDDVTDSELLVSLVLVSMSLPSFLASPLAGPVVDRVDRQRLLVVSAWPRPSAASGLLLLSADRVWVAFVFQGTVAALAAFVKPAIDAAVPNLARTPDELRAANALLGSTWGVMLAVGAGLGGLFSHAFGRRRGDRRRRHHLPRGRDAHRADPPSDATGLRGAGPTPGAAGRRHARGDRGGTGRP